MSRAKSTPTGRNNHADRRGCDGLQQLGRLPRLRHLHMEREDLTAPMFRFAAAMPALTRLTGLDEFGDDGPMPPAEVDQVRAMHPHISIG